MNTVLDCIRSGVGKMSRLSGRSRRHRRLQRDSFNLKLAVAGALMAAGLLSGGPVWADSPAPPIAETQATIKRLGFGLSQITLPARAAKRLDIKTDQIRQDASGRKETPYASIIYDLDGDAWVYTVTAPLTFVRAGVVVELIDREHAYLKEGPPAGTQVVTVGVPELYGTEVGVNGE